MACHSREGGNDTKMKNSILPRIILDLTLVLSVLNGWWFIGIPLMMVGLFYFPYFAEAIIAGIAYDSLFGLIHGMGWRGYVGIIISILLTIGVFLMKSVVRK